MKSMRIAGGLGFSGDSWKPLRASIERGNVQYVASDHLAELALAILQKDRQRDPNLGYTRDLVPMLAEILPIAIPRKRGSQTGPSLPTTGVEWPTLYWWGSAA